MYESIINQKVSELENRYNSKVLGIDEVSDYLGIDANTVKLIAESGEMEYTQAQGKYLFKLINIVKFELDIKKTDTTPDLKSTDEEKENEIVKVTKGSIYNTGSKKNPREIAFTITFDDNTKVRAKARGRNDMEVEKNKQLKIMEEYDKYKSLKVVNRFQPNIIEEQEIIKKFREVADEWFKETYNNIERFNGRGSSFSNISGAETTLKAINKVIGDMPINEIDTNTGNEMLAEVSYDKEKNKTMSDSHVRKARDKFKAVMEYAFVKDYTDKKIGKLILNKNLKKPDKNKRVYDIVEIKAILNAVKDNPRYNTLFHLIIFTGMRQEEALAVDIQDFKENENGCFVYVSKAVVKCESSKYEIVNKLKGDEEPRNIPIPKFVYDMVVRYYNECCKDTKLLKNKRKCNNENLVFTNRDGKVINKNTLYHNMHEYLDIRLKEIKEDKVGLHKFRHSYATILTEQIPIEIVSEILGHSDILITHKFYNSMNQAKTQKVKNVLDDITNKLS